MYRLKLHKTLDENKWKRFPYYKQILMITNELNRAINWIKKEEIEEVNNCYERALELLDITASQTENKNKLKELLRFREILSLEYISKEKNLDLNKKLLQTLISLDKESYKLLNR